VPVTRRRAAVGLGLLALFAVGAAVAPERVFARLRWAVDSPWFPLLLVGLYAVRPFLAWPILVLSALVGFRYGPTVGVPVALAGAVATSLIPYAAGRRAAAGVATGGALGQLVAGSERYFAAAGDLRGVVAARLVPTPAEAISAAAGMGGVSLGAFALGTAVGELPWVVAAVVAGSSARRLAAAGFRPDPGLVAALLAAGLLLLAAPAYRIYREWAGT
jgi:uncharacterized membrane protein YdjX (TVP38/TMEM64 family)